MKFVAILVSAFASLPIGFSWVTSTSKTLAPGVGLTQELSTDPPLLVDTLTVDLKTPGVVIAPAVANDSLTKNSGDIRKGRENVSSLVRRKGVLAAVNGDYFPFTGDPIGLGVMGGELYSEPYAANTPGSRAAIGWLANGKAVVGIVGFHAKITANGGFTMPITGVDRMTALNAPTDVVVYTPRYGPSSGARAGGSEIVLNNVNLPLSPGKQMTGLVQEVISGTTTAPPASIPESGAVVSVPIGSVYTSAIRAHFHPGDNISFVCSLVDATPNKGELHSNDPSIWNSVKQAIGGGPILLKDGQVIVDDAAEGLGAAFSTAPHARTAVGVKADGTAIVVTVDSGSTFSAGISLRDLALLLQQKGAVNAINLDGGGSTTMVADGMTVDYPYGTSTERPVADMLTVNAQPLNVVTNPPVITPLQTALNVGNNYPLSVAEGASIVQGAQQDVIWNGPIGSIGFVTQDGVLHVSKIGHGTITVSVHGQQASLDVDVPAPIIDVPPVAPSTDSGSDAAPQ